MYASEIAAIEDESKRRETYLAEVEANKWFQDTLRQRISCKIGLSEVEQASLYCLLGKGCRERTKNRLRSVIRFLPCIAENYGIYGRVMFDGSGNVFYCAGQSYPDEIRTVRECLLGRR